MAIDYEAWGETYLREAEAIRERLESRRRGGARASYTDAEKAWMRAMYEIYLECSAVGRLLKRRGKRRIAS